jgi:hypothetical protein
MKKYMQNFPVLRLDHVDFDLFLVKYMSGGETERKIDFDESAGGAYPRDAGEIFVNKKHNRVGIRLSRVKTA